MHCSYETWVLGYVVVLIIIHATTSCFYSEVMQLKQIVGLGVAAAGAAGLVGYTGLKAPATPSPLKVCKLCLFLSCTCSVIVNMHIESVQCKL